MIEIKGLSKIYNKGTAAEKHALDKVDFKVNKGEFVAVTGVSGSGKTTLMNIITCLDGFDEGSYFFDGKDMSAATAKEKAQLRNDCMGIIAQNLAIVPDMTVYENIELPLLFDKTTAIKEIKGKVVAAITCVGLAINHKQKVFKLSGGEQQRVAVARAIVNSPSLLVADEPTASLDIGNAARLMDLFESLNKMGITIIIVTHDHLVAERCNRIVSLEDGKIVVH